MRICVSGLAAQQCDSPDTTTTPFSSTTNSPHHQQNLKSFNPISLFDRLLTCTKNVEMDIRPGNTSIPQPLVLRFPGSQSASPKTPWRPVCIVALCMCLAGGSRSKTSRSQHPLRELQSTDTGCSTPSEIAKRAAIFTAVGQLGSMFAGLMMTAVHKTMEGHGGLKGWQWVSIIAKNMVASYCIRGGGL